EKKRRAFQLWIKRLEKREQGPGGRGHRPGAKGREGDPEAEHGRPAAATRDRGSGEGRVCLLPGPVTIAPEVHAAFHRPPIYHRGPDFLDLFEKVRGRLARMVGCRNVAIFNGSGTLGNEVVAATLAAEPRPTNGVILVNGEFGQRLVRQAARFGLSFDVLSWPWGKPWNLGEIERRLTSKEW